MNDSGRIIGAGGRSAMVVPTATVDRVAKLSCWRIAFS